ncbi:MAG: anti-sigma factor [Acidobacteriota bacterium]
MSDEGRSRELNPEDLAIDQAMSQVMATGNEPRLVRGGDAADPAAVREYTELLGLLPYALEPEQPAAHVKQSILDRVSGAQPAPSRAPQPQTQRELDDMTLYGGTAEPVSGEPETIVDSGEMTLRRAPGELPAVKPIQPPAAAANSSSWGSMAIAAMLAVCLVGMGFLGALVWKQSQEIGQLHLQLAAQPASATSADITRVQAQANLLQSRLDMITNVAQSAYPMRRVANTGKKGPEGIVYVCGMHQRWYLNLRGLEPPAPGSEYRLWFMTDEGKVDGGILDVKDGSPAEMEAMSMPDNTNGFLVTLERQDGGTPESLTVLLGEKAINL